MEASTLTKKKNVISKGKLKKSIKNVLCRPDPVFWPEITEDERKRLEITLNKYRIKIPEFKKPHWNELKSIPKEQRPKPPKLKKVEGLLFGISGCKDTLEKDQCAAVIIEATVNPQMIVHPIIELCTSKSVPLLCMKDLRKITLTNFGIKTSCLGLKNECFPELRHEILDIEKLYSKSKTIKTVVKEKIHVEETKQKENNAMDIIEFPYLYRTNKKMRVFVPSNNKSINTVPKKFIGQDFIEFSDKTNDSQQYMKMILKKISNNPNRVKKK